MPGRRGRAEHPRAKLRHGVLRGPSYRCFRRCIEMRFHIMWRSAVLVRPKGEAEMVQVRMWTHGHSVGLERVGAPGATGKDSVLKRFAGSVGDVVDLGGHGSAACLRIGWAARIVVYDNGTKNLPKSGEFWCHFAVPTPVFGLTASVVEVLGNWESSDSGRLFVDRVHVWDGNRRIFADDAVPPAGRHNGGISGHTTDPSRRPSTLWYHAVIGKEVMHGIGVALRVRAFNARDNLLELRGVGIQFDLPLLEAPST